MPCKPLKAAGVLQVLILVCLKGQILFCHGVAFINQQTVWHCDSSDDQLTVEKTRATMMRIFDCVSNPGALPKNCRISRSTPRASGHCVL